MGIEESDHHLLSSSTTKVDSTPHESVSRCQRLFEYILFRFRWIFVIGILLPINIVYVAYFNLRNWFIFTINSAPRAHMRKVAEIQKQVRFIFRFNLKCQSYRLKIGMHRDVRS